MAIKEVKEIPKNDTVTLRQSLMLDIQEAMEKGINKFEFVGNYNYKYLQQYAQECADRIIRNMVLIKYRELRECKLTDAEKAGHLCVGPKMPSEYRPKFIRVTSVKGEEHRRVFCEIDLSDFDVRTEEEYDKALERARQRK